MQVQLIEDNIYKNTVIDFSCKILVRYYSTHHKNSHCEEEVVDCKSEVSLACRASPDQPGLTVSSRLVCVLW